MAAVEKGAKDSMPISHLITDGYGTDSSPETLCRVTRVPLQEGLDIVRWQSTFEQPVKIPLYDDSECIHFSFTNVLKGEAVCSFHDGHRQRRFAIDEGSGNISFGRCRHGFYYQHGEIDNVTVMVSPELLSQWELEIDPPLHKALACDHCFLKGHRNGEMSATAHMLCGAMDQGPSARSSLWLYGQSVTLVSLFMETRRSAECVCRVSHMDRQRLMRARGRLLEDLGKAPSLPELAREAGMSLPKLTRGFRQVFGNSVYGVFQQARMEKARSRLLAGEDSVMRVASDLGYANASHFATAFRKQFGINPSQIRLRS
ncbi:helix-turn-helix transcriptional regulator [Ectothiorhodospira lacustris]|uniref:helix-turn-helix transcriptional regulator n=1 Tax=Ectothiorhodospira lacustris TaxID=2899127 RepID=UPI001EE96A62|nr:AraC family transcriptional regulator [Ectothiorhodospira lacustris]MCG5500608.1 AraC family transcriptional regulator [Ectothiorhodospira lacustris]